MAGLTAGVVAGWASIVAYFARELWGRQKQGGGDGGGGPMDWTNTGLPWESVGTSEIPEIFFFVCFFVCLFVCFFVCLFVCLFVCFFGSNSVNMSRTGYRFFYISYICNMYMFIYTWHLFVLYVGASTLQKKAENSIKARGHSTTPAK